MIYKSYLVEQNINILKKDVVLIYGENDGLKSDLKKKLRLSNSSTNIKNTTQEEILKSQNIFFEDFLNNSLFDEKKIYFIEQVNDKFLSIVHEVEKRSDGQKVYLFAPVLEKKSKLRNYVEKSKKIDVIPCYIDNEITLKNIIRERLKDFKELTPESMNIMLDNSNLNRVSLNNELDKVETYFIDKKISLSSLVELLNRNDNLDITSLKDSALNGNKQKTNRLLNDTVLENDKIIYYINLLYQRLNKLNEILSVKNLPLEKTIDNIKPTIFWKDKPVIKEQAKRWDRTKINLMLKKIFNIEIMIKSNSNIQKDILFKKTNN
jgi:DNA polymerase-3 subunit delta